MTQHLYTDAGCLGPNPSALGGVWAYCLVEDDRLVREASGQLSPTRAGVDPVSNNVGEMWAVLQALESMPAKWTGHLWTDSLCTKLRAENPQKAKMKGVPRAMIDRMLMARVRLGWIEFHLLAGHPSVAHLAAGKKPGSKYPVSKWNKRCDDLCDAAKLVVDPSY